jgi:hypothetical protein
MPREMKLSNQFLALSFPTGVSIHRRKQEWSGRSFGGVEETAYLKPLNIGCKMQKRQSVKWRIRRDAD